ncbi:truncated hemoglobin-like protein [Hyphomicrobium denitrificans 1NES1]|uniref:Truncated hemoglobin-like protein n=1 Tax=Hyphomicrobium denitrificans 1NES1 TaxID=670307 RepID=N0B3Y2_9HYPH|nr:group III truncated hemoglobin [Hyphomicrobium denitrificans]AGK58224.1 truncated hemoglobin-like protein [Hyphomicrobium denitrificans 1NES1]
MSYHPPHPKAPGLAAGVEETMVAELVDRFYAKVRQDELLGPIFNTRIEDWDEHLAKLSAFWSSVVLMTGRYKGQPMPAHIAISEITDEHFERWLALFAETAKVVCPPEAAALFVDRSRRIAESLRLGIAASKGVIA